MVHLSLYKKNLQLLLSFISYTVSMQPKPRQEPEASSAVEEPSKPPVSQSQHDVVNKKETPAQDRCSDRINALQTQIVEARRQLETGMASDPVSLRKTVRETEKKLLEEQKSLKRLTGDAERHIKARDKQKRKMQLLSEKFEEVGPPRKSGRPRIEDEQQGLLETIKDIATYVGAAANKRRSENIRTACTLDDLTSELNSVGYTISRSATYLRLVPHRWNTTEGKRHVSTVPVKLMKAETTEHRSHEDTMFAATTIKHLRQLAGTLGPNHVFMLSQDDKARVPIGITAAKKQAPLLMSMEYRVRLPDHDWVVAERHKLIPSVYALCTIEKDRIGDEKAVTYSGPTYVAIRSGKHDKSTAYSHGDDFCTVVNDLDSFAPFVKVHDGGVKPVVIITTDGGPDENPRYRKVLEVAAQNFLEYNLDAIFLATNAPGRSAFNPVERRMAPLSHDLAGLILPHDHYGSHLDASHNTTDEALERKNFEKAGEVLAEVWSNTVIDTHPVHAAFIQPSDEESRYLSTTPLTEEWLAKHTRQSQYCLQIVKCNTKTCCSPLRSSIRAVLPTGFLPTPVPIVQTLHGIMAPEPEDVMDSKAFGGLYRQIALADIVPKAAAAYEQLPYDIYCPSVATKLNSRICQTCGLYMSSNKAVKLHNKVHNKVPQGKRKVDKPQLKPTTILRQEGNEVLIKVGGQLEWMDIADVDMSTAVRQPPRRGRIPVVQSVEEWAQSPWAASKTQ